MKSLSASAALFVSFFLLSGARALEPASAPAAATPLFKSYSLHDFCLDIQTRINQEHLIPDDFIAIDLFEQAVFAQTPDNVQKTLWLNSPIMKEKLASQLKAALMDSQDKRLNWTVTRFEPSGGASAHCTLTTSGVEGETQIYFAVSLELRETAAGPAITDARNSLFNLPLSHMFAQAFSALYRSMPANAQEPFLSFAAPAGQTGVESWTSFAAIGEFMKFVQQHDEPRVINTYEIMLDDNARASALFQLHYLNAKSTEKDWAAVLERILKQYPDDLPSGYLLSLARLKEDPQRLLSLANHMEQAWGYHPSLDSFRIEAYLWQHDHDSINRTFARALARNDGYEPLYWQMLRILAATRQFERAVLVAAALQKRFDYRMEDLKRVQDKELRELAISPEFRRFLKNNPRHDG